MSLGEKPSVIGVPSWQNAIRTRLMEQQAEQAVNREIAEQYQRLAKTARDLKERNRALLRGGVGAGPSTGDGPSPILSHLDAQLSTLRAELSTVYRTQAASQNRQLALSDALRDRDEEVRGLREEVRDLRDVKEAAARKEKDWDERWKIRSKEIETLNDEILSLNVEVSGMTETNKLLKIDNASLLQRWLDKMNLTAEEMNEEFEKETEEHIDAETKTKGKAKASDAESIRSVKSVKSVRPTPQSRIPPPKTPTKPKTPTPSVGRRVTPGTGATPGTAKGKGKAKAGDEDFRGGGKT